MRDWEAGCYAILAAWEVRLGLGQWGWEERSSLRDAQHLESGEQVGWKDSAGRLGCCLQNWGMRSPTHSRSSPFSDRTAWLCPPTPDSPTRAYLLHSNRYHWASEGFLSPPRLGVS